MNTILVAVTFLVGAWSSWRASDLPVTNASLYRPGQVWRYHTRPKEEQSTLTILRVDSTPKLGIIVHISLDGLRIPNAGAPGGVTTQVGHLPFREDAIRRSVTTKVNDDAPLPDYQDGYADWRRAFDSGRGGVSTITVAEAVGYAEKSLSQ